jgi:hypothetical protein
MKLITHLHLVSRLWMHGVVSSAMWRRMVWLKFTDVSREHVFLSSGSKSKPSLKLLCFLLPGSLVYLLTMKMGVLCTSKTSVNFCQTTRHHFTVNLSGHRRESLKSGKSCEAEWHISLHVMLGCWYISFSVSCRLLEAQRLFTEKYGPVYYWRSGKVKVKMRKHHAMKTYGGVDV